MRFGPVIGSLAPVFRSTAGELRRSFFQKGGNTLTEISRGGTGNEGLPLRVQLGGQIRIEAGAEEGLRAAIRQGGAVGEPVGKVVGLVEQLVCWHNFGDQADLKGSPRVQLLPQQGETEGAAEAEDAR